MNVFLVVERQKIVRRKKSKVFDENTVSPPGQEAKTSQSNNDDKHEAEPEEPMKSMAQTPKQ